MSKLLVAAPLRLEAILISSAARGALVRKTGMGPDRAKSAAGQLAGDAAARLLVVGFCGGLDEESVPGEVIVAEEVYAASDEGHPEGRVRCELAGELVRGLTGRGMKVRVGNVVCVSRLALGERRAELHAGGAIAVDMESVWLAGAASGAPFRGGARRARQPAPRADAPAGDRRGAAGRAGAAPRGGRASRVGPRRLR